ncbi:hypothetical protein DIPPA_23176 [Diplonema papillatum]|nr:hypothetical protein DIPPA_23176 [Diplonema papillatum]
MPKAAKILSGRAKFYGMKSEPKAYSWADLVKEGSTYWDGVRNYQARNVMKDMKIGDIILFYHSVTDKEFVGVCRVVKEFYQDPTTDDTKWVAVDIEPLKPLKKKISLADVKAEAKLASMAMLKQVRLSVFPMTEGEAKHILKMAKTEL